MPNYSAQEIYQIVSKFELTNEQVAAIEHVGSSALVVAGAGSGKTELMSIRAMFLVANELVRPSEILGLTFTRKASVELGNRIQQGLFRLRESPLWPKALGDEFEPAKVATYNSFGNEIFRELALSLGYESDATLITDAMAVSLVKELLKNIDISRYPALEEFERTESYLISLVLAASSQLADNLVTSSDAISAFEEFRQLALTLPQKPGGSSDRFAYTNAVIAQAELNQLIFAIAGEYQELKKERNLVDFSDQVALAYLALETQPLIHSYRQVMLDEYQDTSSIQTMLLSRLFRESEVMAVGDPNQSIYGWRGASSANLESFGADFGSTQSYSLSRSWRSGPKVVQAANLISSGLPEATINPVLLAPGKSFEDRVQAQVFTDEVSEARAVAKWLQSEMMPTTSAAILFRSKSAMSVFTQELAALGLDFEVTGLSGLTEQPEVIDLISALRVLIDPNAAVALMRLLSGPRFRIAPRDLAQLQRFARKLSGFEAGVPVTLIEALDQIRWRKDLSSAQFSNEGEKRLKSAAELLHQMRQQLGLSLVELSWSIVQDLELDIELYAHSRAKNPLSNLQAFISRIADYEQAALRPSLAGLINWLDYALEHESFELPKSGSKQGVVQLMSVHAAKGLEWDLVVVASMVEGAFPVGPKDTSGWLSPGKLPFSLRRDSASLPKLDLAVESQKELNARIGDFKAANRQHQITEERRLAYVAFTRPAKALLITASYYKLGNSKPREVAVFLQELIEAGAVELLTELPEVPEQNPLAAIELKASWPFDPLGSKRLQMEQLATEFENATPTAIDQSLELAALLSELEEDRRPALEIPVRLSASKIVQLMTDPAGFLDGLERPMPQLYTPSAEVGSQFHAALEDAFLSGSELDFSSWSEDQKDLGVNFENSRFATMSPFAVELPIEFAFAGSVVVCKLDAVFETQNGYEIIDWKSGKAPAGEDLDVRAIQLALYRIGLSRFLNVPLERISAAFFFAKEGREIRPELPGESELAERLWELRKAHPLP